MKVQQLSGTLGKNAEAYGCKIASEVFGLFCCNCANKVVNILKLVIVLHTPVHTKQLVNWSLQYV
jgi:hypothetical protein